MNAEMTAGALNLLRREFPFTRYITGERVSGTYKTLLDVVPTLVAPPAKILDFGSGPCDKAALLSLLGYECHAADDLDDPGHQDSSVRGRIDGFARAHGVHFVELARDVAWPWSSATFDMVMLHDVLEHLHASPRELLTDLVELLRPGGYLFVTVPNAGNLKKRVKLLLGGTNMPEFTGYYWEPGAWRGHVREYVRADLQHLVRFLDLELVSLEGRHHMIGGRPMPVRIGWRALTSLRDGWRDSWALVARKRPGWQARRSLGAHAPEQALRLRSLLD